MRPSDNRSDAPDIDELAGRALSLKPAPAPLRHVQLLLNSRNLLGGYDLLSDEATAREWLAVTAEKDGEAGTPSCDDQALIRLRQFREALRDLLSSHATDHAPDREALRHLRFTGMSTALSVDFDDAGRAILVPPRSSRGVQRVIDDVMAALVSAPDTELRRLKACLNPACGWVFYDTSRSRSGSWCLMNVCGARHKMERYRSRRQ